MIPSRLPTYALPTEDELPVAKVEWAFDPNRAALLIHDMQQYFMDFYDGGYPDLVANINRLRSLGIPTIYTQQPANQTHAERGLLRDRWGAGPDHRIDIIEPLRPHEADHRVIKRRYSAFHATDMEQILQEAGRDQLLICGVYAHIGITATAIDAFSRDIAPFVVADAIADFDRDRHILAINHLAATCSRLVTADDVSRPQPPSLEDVRRQVLALLDDDVDDEDNLIEAGLDSIRVMSLIEQWKAAGIEVAFADLAADPTITGFHQSLAGE